MQRILLLIITNSPSYIALLFYHHGEFLKYKMFNTYSTMCMLTILTTIFNTKRTNLLGFMLHNAPYHVNLYNSFIASNNMSAFRLTSITKIPPELDPSSTLTLTPYPSSSIPHSRPLSTLSTQY